MRASPCEPSRRAPTIASLARARAAAEATSRASGASCVITSVSELCRRRSSPPRPRASTSTVPNELADGVIDGGSSTLSANGAASSMPGLLNAATSMLLVNGAKTASTPPPQRVRPGVDGAREGRDDRVTGIADRPGARVDAARERSTERIPAPRPARSPRSHRRSRTGSTSTARSDVGLSESVTGATTASVVDDSVSVTGATTASDAEVSVSVTGATTASVVERQACR